LQILPKTVCIRQATFSNTWPTTFRNESMCKMPSNRCIKLTLEESGEPVCLRISVNHFLVKSRAEHFADSSSEGRKSTICPTTGNSTTKSASISGTFRGHKGSHSLSMCQYLRFLPSVLIHLQPLERCCVLLPPGSGIAQPIRIKHFCSSCLPFFLAVKHAIWLGGVQKSACYG
jgi:hypothetical protein